MSAEFTFDERTMKIIREVRDKLNLKSNTEVIRQGIALMKLCADQADSDDPSLKISIQRNAISGINITLPHEQPT